MKIEEYNKALEIIDKSLSLDSKYSPAYNMKGMIYEKMGNNNESIQAFSKAIEFNSNNGGYYENRAFVYRSMNQFYFNFNFL